MIELLSEKYIHIYTVIYIFFSIHTIVFNTVNRFHNMMSYFPLYNLTLELSILIYKNIIQFLHYNLNVKTKTESHKTTPKPKSKDEEIDDISEIIKKLN